MALIPDSTIERALDVAVGRGADISFEDMKAALKAVEGNFEQQFANEQVRQGRLRGQCVTCGAEM